jgi:hypothetical protein
VYFIAHITSSVFINDDERGPHANYEDWLEELAPHEPVSQYRHNRTGEACPERSQRGVEGTTVTPTSSARRWAARSSWRSPTGGWTLARFVLS